MQRSSAMTIFLDIAKLYLTAAIKKIKDDSTYADNSASNKFFNWLNFGRDKELSMVKRSVADKLLIHLEQISDDKTDEKTLEQLKKLLSESKDDAAEASHKKNYNEGHFGSAIDNVTLVLEKLFKRIKKANLLNIPHDNEPLNIFRYYIATYYAQKIEDIDKMTMVQKLMQNPKLTSFYELSENKEELVTQTLAACEKDLQTLDAEHRQYKVTKKFRVLEWLDRLGRANDELCKQYSAHFHIPVYLAFTSINIQLPSLHPNGGFLELCMHNARQAIDSTYSASKIMHI